jgi:tRNA pseudouridine13 synthase
MTSLQERGFINYYGMQRFGSSSVPTHRIGSAVLLSNWAQVIDLLLMPRENEQEEYAMARRHWEGHHDPQEALKLFPRRCVAEIAILRALSDKPTDLVGAFSTIPYNMRTMYVHAYQSYVWNCMCSERIRRFDPLRAVVGDLVYTKNEAGADSSKVILLYDTNILSPSRCAP